MVRLNCQWQSGRTDSSGYNYSPASLSTFVTNLTSAKVVVLIEDHVGSNQVPKGSKYTAEMQWYANMAIYYKNNLYVWFGTINEPYGNTLNAMCRQELDIYNAIRNTGNDSPITMQVGSLATPWANQGPWFQNMHNVIWEPHVYELLGNIPSTQAAVNARMAGILKEMQYANSVKSVDGVMPCIIGEYGTSVSGDGVDVNGTQTVTAVQTSGCGSCAWTWAADANHDRLQTWLSHQFRQGS